MDKKQLIDGIKQTMPNIIEEDTDKELKMALYIYITLGKKKSFDERYYLGNKKTREKIVKLANMAKVNVENTAKERKIVCLNLAYLYVNILKEFGIDAFVEVEIDEENNHYVPIILLKDGRKIKADIQQDLHHIQTISRLKNFKSINTEKTQNISEERLTQLLIDIGYINEEKDYRDEKIEELKKEVESLNAKESLTKILEDKRVCEIEDELGYVEAMKYYKSVLKQVIPQCFETKIHRCTCYREIETNEKEYTICLYAEEKNTITPFLFSKKANRFIKTDLTQLNQWQDEGLVIGNEKMKDDSKLLKKYMKREKEKNSRNYGIEQ